MKQGDIVVIAFPFSDLSERKLRPAVVLSNASYNRHKNVILAGAYGKRVPRSIPLSNAMLVKKKLKKDSFISFQNMFSIERDMIARKIDALTPPALRAVLHDVHNCF